MWQGLVGWLDGGGREVGLSNTQEGELRVTNSFPTYFGSLEVGEHSILKYIFKGLILCPILEENYKQQ